MTISTGVHGTLIDVCRNLYKRITFSRGQSDGGTSKTKIHTYETTFYFRNSFFYRTVSTCAGREVSAFVNSLGEKTERVGSEQSTRIKTMATKLTSPLQSICLPHSFLCREAGMPGASSYFRSVATHDINLASEMN